MGLSIQQLNTLELLAVLHDIGKVAIEEGILMNPGSLTEEEWGKMRKHCEIGYRIAQSAPELSHIAEYILSHHERWDGKGYPQGLKGEEIPLLSRILAVADAFDAMIHDRPYRKAMSREKAMAELKRNAGTQFDPDVVGVATKLDTFRNVKIS
ncbi:MAG: HD-GYP domain-containing protein [Syntrophaceticus schinkii]